MSILPNKDLKKGGGVDRAWSWVLKDKRGAVKEGRDHSGQLLPLPLLKPWVHLGLVTRALALPAPFSEAESGLWAPSSGRVKKRPQIHPLPT